MTVIPFEPRKKQTTSPAEDSLRETYLTLENQIELLNFYISVNQITSKNCCRRKHSDLYILQFQFR